MAENQENNLTPEESISKDCIKLKESNENEKPELLKSLIQSMKQYIDENDSIGSKLWDNFIEHLPGIFHSTFHLMIEIFFKHGKNRLIATGVFSVITMIPSFIIKIFKSKDWKILLINNIYELINLC